jgi:hypothetical protein
MRATPSDGGGDGGDAAHHALKAVADEAARRGLFCAREAVFVRVAVDEAPLEGQELGEVSEAAN